MVDRVLTGRTVIYTDYDVIDESNVVEVLKKAIETHQKNASDIDYLYKYYKGEQPILHRTKEVRPEICNTIVVNRANEIVTFKVGYLMAKPIQYISRGGSENSEKKSTEIAQINDFVFAEDKAAKDKTLADWFTICGTAYRLILPDNVGEEDEAPFEIETLDPRNTFVVYHNGLGNKPKMGVTFVVRDDSTTLYSVYTDKAYYEIEDKPLMHIVTVKPHILGEIPIIEYPADEARLGAFEIVMPLLDSINLTASNRLDSVEQFVQAFMVIKGADIADETIARIKDLGGLKVPAEGDIEYLTQEINQDQTQTLVDDMYQTVLTICGMPNRNGGSSTSDTGIAVELRDGFSAAETRAANTETMFKKSERVFLKILLNITNAMRGTSLKQSDVDIHFTRRNFENIQTKSQVLVTMLNNDKIHPQLAFEHCGLFVDSENAYLMSKAYYDEQQSKQASELDSLTGVDGADEPENGESTEVEQSETDESGESA